MDLKVFLEACGISVSRATRTRTSASTQPAANFADAVSSVLAKDGGETGYDNAFAAAAAQYQIPASLLKAVGKAESAFTATAVSRCGAQGIMQLMPGTARAMGVRDSFDPAQNIMGGAKYLRQMLDRFDGDVSLALAAYNAGPGTVARCHGVPKSTQKYVSKVLSYVDSFSDAAPSVPSGLPVTSAVSAHPEILTKPLTAVSETQTAEPVNDDVQKNTAAKPQESSGLTASTGAFQTACLPTGTVSQESVRVLLQELTFRGLNQNSSNRFFL